MTEEEISPEKFQSSIISLRSGNEKLAQII